MHLTAKEKEAIFKKYGGDSKNTGSTEGQIALFTNRISHLTNHLKNNKKDKNTQRALQLLVGKRRGLLDYLMNKDIEKYRDKISKIIGIPKNTIKLNVNEIKKPELDAQLVSEGIAQQLERRIMYRRAMKRAVTNTMRLGALGIKVNVAGRLNGAEIARSEWYREGRVPLHTLRANIDFGFSEALTTYGIIGIKVWIYHEDEKEDDNGKTVVKKTKE